MFTATSVPPRIEEGRYLSLLRAANAIATSSDCNTASDTLIKELREVTPFDSLHVVAFDKETNAPCWYVAGSATARRIDPPSEGALSLEDSPIRWVHDSGRALTMARLDPGNTIPGLWAPADEAGHRVNLHAAVDQGAAPSRRIEPGQILSECLR